MTTKGDLIDNLINNCNKPGNHVGGTSLLSQLFGTTLQSTNQSSIKELPVNPPDEE
jgi:hypothetical protein